MKRNQEETIKQAKALYKKYKNYEDPPSNMAIALKVTRSYVIHLWPLITGVPYEKKSSRTGVYNSSEDNSPKPIIQIPEFIPRCKHVTDKNGKQCTDVSEFFGIIENGGECYKNLHFTIPKGSLDSYRNNISDYYI